MSRLSMKNNLGLLSYITIYQNFYIKTFEHMQYILFSLLMALTPRVQVFWTVLNYTDASTKSRAKSQTWLCGALHHSDKICSLESSRMCKDIQNKVSVNIQMSAKDLYRKMLTLKMGHSFQMMKDNICFLNIAIWFLFALSKVPSAFYDVCIISFP